MGLRRQSNGSPRCPRSLPEVGVTLRIFGDALKSTTGGGFRSRGEQAPPTACFGPYAEAAQLAYELGLYEVVELDDLSFDLEGYIRLDVLVEELLSGSSQPFPNGPFEVASHLVVRR